ncbi:unnamed protein product [Ilex paraguariensis]|uniref:Uncharacterized protein n=1 Tax=Ilex paraguariensis TaxID=185542 RepID=A0ABC8SK65_9AQUA
MLGDIPSILVVWFVFHSNILILVEVDHLQDAPSPYIQIKGVNKETVTIAGSTLQLDGSYTTKSYLQIILERLPVLERSSNGIHTQQAARLQELVEFIQSQDPSMTAINKMRGQVASTRAAFMHWWEFWFVLGKLGLLDALTTIPVSSSASESPSREVSPLEGVIEDMQSRIRRLERWQTINAVLWTFLMSAFVGYSVYQRKHQ